MSRRKSRRPLARLSRAVRNAVMVRTALAASRIVPLFPLELLHLLADGMGRIAAAAGGDRKQRVYRHLELAFPEKDQAWRHRIARESYQSAGRLFLEALWMAAFNPEVDEDRIILDTPDEWARTMELAHRKNRGLIAFASHLGAMEMSGPWFSPRVGMPVLAIAARPKIEQLEQPMREVRERAGVRLLYRGGAGSTALRHVLGHGALVMLVDHNLEGTGVDVPFFGHPAHTLLAPARLALQSGGVANTFFCLRDGYGRFRIQCDEPIDLETPSRDKAERLEQETRLTVEYTRRIEEKIRRYPGQYLWMHKRWEKQSATPSSPQQ